jgi:hypothetical protein
MANYKSQLPTYIEQEGDFSRLLCRKIFSNCIIGNCQFLAMHGPGPNSGLLWAFKPHARTPPIISTKRDQVCAPSDHSQGIGWWRLIYVWLQLREVQLHGLVQKCTTKHLEYFAMCLGYYFLFMHCSFPIGAPQV